MASGINSLSIFSRFFPVQEPQAVVSFEERFAYYERAKKAYAVVATGEEKQYANIILKKGCVL